MATNNRINNTTSNKYPMCYPCFEERRKMTTHYLSLNAFAKRIGVTMHTIRSYAKEGRLPAPDAVIGEPPSAKQGWLPETIDTWQANRPGRGARTDLR